MQLVKLVDGRDTAAAVAVPQRSAARQALAHANDEIAQRQAEAEEAAAPAKRLQAVIKAAASARWALEISQARDRQALASANRAAADTEPSGERRGGPKAP